jgi:hypothetical protein
LPKINNAAAGFSASKEKRMKLLQAARNGLLATSAVAAMATMPMEARAWNIICGVSIAYAGSCEGGEALLARQYSVDSKLLRGISEYYAAFSELQTVDIEAVKAGKAADKDKAQVKSGAAAMKTSTQTLQAAIEEGNQLLTDTGKMKCNFLKTERDTAKDTLAQAQKLADLSNSMMKKIESGVLPSVSALHAGLAITQTITSNGLKLSQAHMGKAHHSGAKEEVKLAP